MCGERYGTTASPPSTSQETISTRRSGGTRGRELAPELPLGRHRFIQDGVPFHWTLAVSNWFADHRVRLIEDFPAKSPDLNAIEYVWGWMKRSIATHEPHDYDSGSSNLFCMAGLNPNRHPPLHRPRYHGDEGNYRCQRRTFTLAAKYGRLCDRRATHLLSYKERFVCVLFAFV